MTPTQPPIPPLEWTSRDPRRTLPTREALLALIATAEALAAAPLERKQQQEAA